jgi:hypothetical protein
MSFVDYVAEYFRGPAGATGPAGPTGATGATGPAGPAGPGSVLYAKTGTTTLSSGGPGSLTVQPDNVGDMVLSASFYVTHYDETFADNAHDIVIRSHSYDGTSWTFNWDYTAPVAQNGEPGNLSYRVVFATPTA